MRASTAKATERTGHRLRNHGGTRVSLLDRRFDEHRPAKPGDRRRGGEHLVAFNVLRFLDFLAAAAGQTAARAPRTWASCDTSVLRSTRLMSGYARCSRRCRAAFPPATAKPCSRPEQPRQRACRQPEKIYHREPTSPDSRLLASRIRFPVGSPADVAEEAIRLTASGHRAWPKIANAN